MISSVALINILQVNVANPPGSLYLQKQLCNVRYGKWKNETVTKYRVLPSSFVLFFAEKCSLNSISEKRNVELGQLICAG